MRTDLVSQEELHQAKALLLRQIPLSESSEDSVATSMLTRAQLGLPLDEPLHAAQTYFKLTAEQIRTAFIHHINTTNLVQVVRGPAPK
jgi:zinc protease